MTQIDGCRGRPVSARCPARPGKIIAIHLNYPSRADQRGRRPRSPSYFLKPSSSVAASGGTIERPAGTELLAFEGEIALVIGTAARRVALERRLEPRRAGSPPRTTSASTTCARTTRARTSARRAATASRRSAPTLIDARAVDPAALRAAHLGQRRARAGRHDRRRCSSRSPSSSPTSRSTSRSSPATSSSPARPAGSSVVVPGRRRRGRGRRARRAGRAELRPPRHDRHAGRRRRFDPTLGSLPAVDDAQRAEAWGSARGRRAARRPADGCRRAARVRACTDELLASCAQAPARAGRGPQRAAAQARPQRRHRSTACAPTAPGRQARRHARRPCASCPAARTSSRATAAATTRRSARSTPSARAR